MKLEITGSVEVNTGGTELFCKAKMRKGKKYYKAARFILPFKMGKI